MILLGQWLLPVAAALTAAAMVGFWRLHREHEAARRPARFLFYLACGTMQVAAAILLNAILTHRFDIDYVFTNSSTDLPYLYLLSTFWAGQEGTFTLWALYGGFLGLTLMARTRDWEGTVMAIWCLLCLAVFGMLLVKSPFAPTSLAMFSDVERQFIANQCGGVPPEGNGLNPLLQNPWMVIHPPILFLGFATMAVPFAFALAGLVRREPDAWIVRCGGWVLLGWAILGTGLILGGYWAYETLGWGGYWAWDPVENSSLVPWLFAGALFHGQVLQRASRGALRRTNLVLAAMAFCSVTFGSYLNRSGVLSDFSVHSFVALSQGFNRALACFAAFPPLLFLGLYLAGRPALARVELDPATLSRKQLLHWVTLLLAGSGTLVLIGNSWPLISQVLSVTPGLKQLVPQASSLQPAFYNQTHTPLAIVMASLVSLALLTGWDSLRREQLAAGLKWPLLAALAATVAFALSLSLYFARRAEHPDWLHPTAGRLAVAWGTLVVLSTLAAAVNLRVLYHEFRRGERWTLGTHVAHIGFSLLVIGVVVSSVYETKTQLTLAQDTPQTFLGCRLTYQGLEPRGPNAEVRVSVERGAQQVILKPVLRPTRDGIVWNPGILKSLSHDLYVEPGEVRPAQMPGALQLQIDQPLRYQNLEFEFVKFDLGSHHADMDPSNFGVTVELKVTTDGSSSVVKPRFVVRDGAMASEPADLPGGGRVRVVGIPERGDGSGERFLLLQLEGEQFGAQPETLVAQVTIKPGMSVLWLGCWMACGGALLAAARRGREALKRGF